MDDDDELILSETDNYVVWVSAEDKEKIYHLEMGILSLHFNSEEWDEFVTAIKGADADK